jgi:hypothetical protein
LCFDRIKAEFNNKIKLQNYNLYRRKRNEESVEYGKILESIWKELLLNISNEYVIKYEDVFFNEQEMKLYFTKKSGGYLFANILNCCFNKKNALKDEV